MMKAKYNGLYIREATEEENEHGKLAWGDDFSGWMAVRPDSGTYFILKETARYTPYGTYRMNAAHTMLIHACYSQYDTIFLEGNIAVSEIHDCNDNF
mgnify:CR=1 FL=1